MGGADNFFNSCIYTLPFSARYQDFHDFTFLRLSSLEVIQKNKMIELAIPYPLLLPRIRIKMQMQILGFYIYTGGVLILLLISRHRRNLRLKLSPKQED